MGALGAATLVCNKLSSTMRTYELGTSKLGETVPESMACDVFWCNVWCIIPSGMVPSSRFWRAVVSLPRIKSACSACGWCKRKPLYPRMAGACSWRWMIPLTLASSRSSFISLNFSWWGWIHQTGSGRPLYTNNVTLYSPVFLRKTITSEKAQLNVYDMLHLNPPPIFAKKRMEAQEIWCQLWDKNNNLSRFFPQIVYLCFPQVREKNWRFQNILVVKVMKYN